VKESFNGTQYSTEQCPYVFSDSHNELLLRPRRLRSIGGEG